MGRGLTQLAFIHPGWLALAFLVTTALAVVAGAPGLPPPISGLLSISGAIVIFVWPWALYRASRFAGGRADPPARDHQWVYATLLGLLAATIVISAVTGQAGFHLDGPLGAALSLPLMALILAAFWMPASAIERVNADCQKPDFARVSLTAVLLFFYVFGAWILRPRILAVRASLTT